MKKHENAASILSTLDLHDIEEIISQPYHKKGPGKPPRSPLGIFKALVVKQLRNIPARADPQPVFYLLGEVASAEASYLS